MHVVDMAPAPSINASASSNGTSDTPTINTTCIGLHEWPRVLLCAGYLHIMSRFGGVSDMTCDMPLAELLHRAFYPCNQPKLWIPPLGSHRLGSGAFSTSLGLLALGDSRILISFCTAGFPVCTC